MSRCTVCNVIMSESELKHKDTLTGKYTDMCFDCLGQHEALVNDVDEYEVLYTDNTSRFNGLTSDDLLDSGSTMEYNDTL